MLECVEQGFETLVCLPLGSMFFLLHCLFYNDTCQVGLYLGHLLSWSHWWALINKCREDFSVFILTSLQYLTLCYSVAKSSQLFVTLWTAACQASLAFIISWSVLTLMSIESVILSNHLIPYHPLLLLPSIFPSMRVFSSESALHIRWPKYWSFSFSISPSMNMQGWFPLGLTGWISLQSKGLSRVFTSTTIQKHQFFGAQPSLWSNSHIRTWVLEKP